MSDDALQYHRMLVAADPRCPCGKHKTNPLVEEGEKATLWAVEGRQPALHVPRRCASGHTKCGQRRWCNYLVQGGVHIFVGDPLEQNVFLSSGAGFSRDFMIDFTTRVFRNHATFEGLVDQ